MKPVKIFFVCPNCHGSSVGLRLEPFNWHHPCDDCPGEWAFAKVYQHTELPNMQPLYLWPPGTDKDDTWRKYPYEF
jgi:hypothetical protein